MGNLIPTTFVSYSHVDRAVARRISWRLRALGMSVWFDESDLRLGDVLGPVIERQIESSATVIVIASEAAASSAWVEKEMRFAIQSERPPRICPIFIDDVKNCHLFADYRGLDAPGIHDLERDIARLAEGLLGTVLPPPACGALGMGLDAIRRDQPRLAPLIDDCLLGEGLQYSHLEGAAQVPFHEVDFAINAMYDVADESRKGPIANAAAELFSRCGAGKYTLEKQVALLHDETLDMLLLTAVAAQLHAREFDAAMDLLSACAPPSDYALAKFIERNIGSMSSEQRQRISLLATYPTRGPANCAVDAAYAALRHMPESADLRALWRSWIGGGLFDGFDKRGCHPETLAFWLNEAHTLELTCWDEVANTLLTHVYNLARSTERAKVVSAVEHVKASSSHDWLLEKVSSRVESALLRANWDNWVDAEEMKVYAKEFLRAARSDRDWGRAKANIEKTMEALLRERK